MGSRFSAAAQIVFSRRPLWSLTDQIIVSGANFVTMIILARRLGLADFGAFTLYWTSVLFLAALHAAFIIMPMVVLHAQHEADARRTYHGTVAGLHLSFVGAALAVSLPLLALLAAVGLVALEVMLPLVACFAFGLMHEYLRRLIFLEDKFLDLAGSDLARYVLQILGLMLLGGPGGLTIMAAFWVLAGSALVGCLVCLRHVPAPAFQRDQMQAVAARHWSSSKWLLSSSLLSWISANSLIYLVGAFAGTAAVGTMRACENLAGIMSIPLQGLYNVVPTEASTALVRQGPQGLRGYLVKVVLGLLAAGAAVTLGLAAAPERWLTIAYGGEFSGYGYLLVGYGLAFVGALLELPISAGLRSLEQTRPVFLAYAWGTAFTVGAGVLLVPPFGVWGAMAVILVAWAIRLVIASRSLALALNG